MTLNTRIKAKLHELGSRLMFFLVQTLVPRYVRRAILMCSLASILKEDTEHKKLATLVCRELSIDSFCDVNAMLAPMQWKSRIWGDLPGITFQNCQQGERLAKAVRLLAARVPRPLRYASERATMDDIFRTFRAAGKA